jgi:hypothetical protein
MMIRSRMGVSAAGFVSPPQGVPAVVMGRALSCPPFPDGSAGLAYTPA